MKINFKVVAVVALIVTAIVAEVVFSSWKTKEEVPQQQLITLNLSPTDVQYIINILAEQPYKNSADLIRSIAVQAQMAQTKATQPSEPKKDTTSSKKSKK